MKKRLVSVITVVTLVLSLVACGDKSSDESASTDVEELQKQIESLQSQVSDLQVENEELKSKSGDTGIIDAAMDVVDPTDPDDPSTWSDDMVITFTDPLLAADVRTLLSLQDGNITYGMVKNITDFDMWNEIFKSNHSSAMGYSDIGSLKYLTGLKNLSLSTDSEDLTGISNLLNLEQLSIAHCDNLTDISALKNLSNLEQLSINSCDNLTDISAVGELSNCTSLELDMLEGVTDVTPLKKMTNLEKLYLGVGYDDEEFNFKYRYDNRNGSCISVVVNGEIIDNGDQISVQEYLSML